MLVFRTGTCLSVFESLVVAASDIAPGSVIAMGPYIEPNGFYAG